MTGIRFDGYYKSIDPYNDKFIDIFRFYPNGIVSQMEYWDIDREGLVEPIKKLDKGEHDWFGNYYISGTSIILNLEKGTTGHKASWKGIINHEGIISAMWASESVPSTLRKPETRYIVFCANRWKYK
jgi:hypothetical protein